METRHSSQDIRQTRHSCPQRHSTVSKLASATTTIACATFWLCKIFMSSSSAQEKVSILLAFCSPCRAASEPQWGRGGKATQCQGQKWRKLIVEPICSSFGFIQALQGFIPVVQPNVQTVL